jgi:hypothetical protein
MAIQDFVEAVRQSVKQRNWYAALGLALALPDICADLEKPNRGSQKRYADWWNTYLTTAYKTPDRISQATRVSTLLNGNDCYALRCAFLHNGRSDITAQKAREVLNRFHFTFPTSTTQGSHRNLFIYQTEKVLQLEVDSFCEDICLGVEQWISKKLSKDPAIQKRAEEMLKIFPAFAFVPKAP